MIGNECNFEDEDLQVHVQGFFMDLYSMDYHIRGSLYCKCSFPSLDSSEFSSLLAGASNEEIRRAVFSMAPLKAPGLDGFQASFF